MSDQANSHYQEPINGLKPLSNAESYDLPATASDLSRRAERAEFSYADGQPLGEAEIEEDDDDEEEEVEGEYVAVDHDDINEYPYWFRRPPVHQRTKLDELHPFVQVLTESSVEDCVKVEEAFPEHERCSREKVWVTCWMLCASRANWLELGLIGFTVSLSPEQMPGIMSRLVYSSNPRGGRA